MSDQPQTGSLSVTSILGMLLEDALRIAFEHRFTVRQPGPRLVGQRRPVEIELLDLFQPALKLLEVRILFLKLGIVNLLIENSLAISASNAAPA